jgi:hypothetical protein
MPHVNPLGAAYSTFILSTPAPRHARGAPSERANIELQNIPDTSMPKKIMKQMPFNPAFA